MWWRDLWKVSSNIKGNNLHWFENGVKKIVGNGQSTSFWAEPWVGSRILRNDFERLYSISSNKEARICELGSFDNGRWVWNLCWRRNLFEWEK